MTSWSAARAARGRLFVRLVAFLGSALLLLGVVVAIRTFTFTSRQLRVLPAAPLPVDSAGAAERLAGALRIPTISREPASAPGGETFGALHAYLAQAFPGVHARLERELVGRDALLYTWTGTEAALPPLVLCAHLDVVPVEPGTERAWSHPPFAGEIADGYIWGRGALDDKLGAVGLLEAAEILIARGFQPRRTVLLAFGADEEIGGGGGAAVLSKAIQSRYRSAALVLDEGGIISSGGLPGVSAPVALVGIAEKGVADIEIAARGEGGHSALPPAHTAVGIVARAVARLEAHPFRAALRGPASELFEYVGPEMPLPARLVFANRWLFRPLIERRLAAAPATDAMLRTTMAVTMIEGSPKSNVLPVTARAVLNVRMLPGDSAAAVEARVRGIVADPAVQVKTLTATEASPVAPTSAAAWTATQQAIREVFPEAIVAPYLTVGATDARHYAALTRNIHRFLPVRLEPQDLARLHGTNERTSIAGYVHAVRFYARLMQKAAQ